MPNKFTKQPAEVKDYDFEWEQWLSTTSGDLISSVNVTATAGITVDSSQIISGLTVKVWLSAGTDGSDYRVTCRITTVQGRVAETEIMIYVREL